MEAFATVMEQGGFTDAARKTGISTSAVSKHVLSLAARLGAWLLNRTTRRVSPTEIGLTCYDRARPVLNDAEKVDALVTGMQSEPSGLLRIGGAMDFWCKNLRSCPVFCNRFGGAKQPDWHIDDRRDPPQTPSDSFRPGLKKGVRTSHRAKEMQLELQAPRSHGCRSAAGSCRSPMTRTSGGNAIASKTALPASGIEGPWDWRRIATGYHRCPGVFLSVCAPCNRRHVPAMRPDLGGGHR